MFAQATDGCLQWMFKCHLLFWLKNFKNPKEETKWIQIFPIGAQEGVTECLMIMKYNINHMTIAHRFWNDMLSFIRIYVTDHWSCSLNGLQSLSDHVSPLSGLTPDRLGPPSQDASPVTPEPTTPGAQSPSHLHYHSKAQHRRFSMEVSSKGLKEWL